MASSASGEEMQAASYQLAPFAPTGFGLAVEVVAISLGIVGFIVASLRAYLRLGFPSGFGRSGGLDDILAAIGTVSSLSSMTDRPTEASIFHKK